MNNQTSDICLVKQIVDRLSSHVPRELSVDMPDASVLVPITRNSSNPEIILTRRTEHLTTHKGQVAFPGGKRDANDASLLHTALRESHEEIGLESGQVEVIGQLGGVVSLHGIRVTPFVGIVDDGIQLRANPYELESIFRVPLSFFLHATPVRRDKMTYQNMKLSVPAYHYETNDSRYEIWGLSAMILVEFLNLALDADIQLHD